MLPRSNRITKKSEFDLLKSKGTSIGSDLFALLYLNKNLSIPRFGIIVSKKVSKKAVNRNSCKRKVRKALKSLISKVPAYDYLIIVRKDIEEMGEELVLEKITKVIERIK